MKTFSNIWNAIEDTPEQAENMKIRSHLMRFIEGRIRADGWSQEEAAERFGVDPPRISELMHGKIENFSVESLMDMLVAAGFQNRLNIIDLDDSRT